MATRGLGHSAISAAAAIAVLLLVVACREAAAFAPPLSSNKLSAAAQRHSSSCIATTAPLTTSSTTIITTTTTTSLLKSSPIDISEYAQRNIQLLEEWAINNGIQKIDGLELYTEDGMDWQYITTVDIPAGTTIMYIPADVCLSSSTIANRLSSMSNSISQAVDQLTRIGGQNSISDFYLFVFLLVEYEAGENSAYRPYLDALPRLYFNSVSMTEFCYECLPPLVFSLSRLERVKYDNFKQVLVKVDLVSDYVKRNDAVLQWAFNSVYTRAYADKEGQGSDVTITPLADMFNHGTETEIEMYFDEMGNAMAYTTVDVRANSPLRISYGCPTNPSFLFARYGFLDESSPATFCKIMDIPKTPENVDMGMDFSKMLFYHDTGDISPEVMDVVLYAKVLAGLKSSPETDGYKQAFYQAHMSGDENTKAMIHDQFRYDTLSEIKKHVDKFLELLDSLERKSYGKNLDDHPRLPLILRHNEFVKQTFLRVQSNLIAAGV